MLHNHYLGLYEKALEPKLSWQERLTAAKKLGFDFVEISIDETDERLARLDWNAEERARLHRAMQETGIPLRSMCLSAHRRFPFGSADPEKRQRAYEIMEKAIDFAQEFDIKVIQLAGYDVYYEESTEESRQAFLDGLKWSCRLAEQKEIMLAMEIMDTPFLNSITKNLWYEEQLRSPWYTVYPDLGNLSAWGNDVERELEKGRGSIVAVHIKDTLAVTPTFEGKFKCVPFGTGCVDFVSCFRKLEELEYRGPYMIEMWNDPQKDNMAEIAAAKRFVEENYRKAMELIHAQKAGGTGK